MTEYRPRLVDAKLSQCLRVFGAVSIVGPKWCGKTTTAMQVARSVVRLQDPDEGALNRSRAMMMPSEVLKGENPRLIDEWQVVPQLWDAVRVSVDSRGEKGLYILTGSANASRDGTMHSGTGRIYTLRMGTLTLFESGDSTGSVSLRALFDGASGMYEASGATLRGVAGFIVRGGWPESVGMGEEDARLAVEGYCESILETEVRGLDGRRRSPHKMRAVLRSLSRNTSYSLSKRGLMEDVGGSGEAVSANTLDDYLDALRGIHVLEGMPAWNPNLRSKTAVRTAETIHLCDPAVSAYFLSATPEGLMSDPATFGPLFESLAVRDLRTYVRCIGGDVFHYRDANGLEVDAVLHLHDGRWALVEVKLGLAWVDEAAKNLKRVSGRIDVGKMGSPSFLAVVVPNGDAYTRPDGVHVVPLTCLRDRSGGLRVQVHALGLQLPPHPLLAEQDRVHEDDPAYLDDDRRGYGDHRGGRQAQRAHDGRAERYGYALVLVGRHQDVGHPLAPGHAPPLLHGLHRVPEEERPQRGDDHEHQEYADVRREGRGPHGEPDEEEYHAVHEDRQRLAGDPHLREQPRHHQRDADYLDDRDHDVRHADGLPQPQPYDERDPQERDDVDVDGPPGGVLHVAPQDVRQRGHGRRERGRGDEHQAGGLVAPLRVLQQEVPYERDYRGQDEAHEDGPPDGLHVPFGPQVPERVPGEGQRHHHRQEQDGDVRPHVGVQRLGEDAREVGG